MLKKHYKKAIVILFLGIFLYSGFLFMHSNMKGNLCNIDYPFQALYQQLVFTL